MRQIRCSQKPLQVSTTEIAGWNIWMSRGIEKGFLKGRNEKNAAFPALVFLLSLSLSWSLRVALGQAEFKKDTNTHKGAYPSPVPKKIIPFLLCESLLRPHLESHRATMGTEKQREGKVRGKALAVLPSNSFISHSDTCPAGLSSLEFLWELHWKV